MFVQREIFSLVMIEFSAQLNGAKELRTLQIMCNQRRYDGQWGTYWAFSETCEHAEVLEGRWNKIYRRLVRGHELMQKLKT